MQRKVLAVGGIALALAVAACGGSDGSGSGSGSGGSSADAKAVGFHAQAIVACKDARKRGDRVAGKGLSGLFDRAIAYETAKVSGLRALTAPDKLQDQFAQYLQLIAARRDQFTQFRESHATQLTKTFEKRVAQLRGRDIKLAGALDLKACRD